jgi:hypothetical protein
MELYLHSPYFFMVLCLSIGTSLPSVYSKQTVRYCDVHAVGQQSTVETLFTTVAWQCTRTQQWLLQQWENCIFYGIRSEEVFSLGSD